MGMHGGGPQLAKVLFEESVSSLESLEALIRVRGRILIGVDQQ
jgi:hypothetical protein